MGQRYWRAIAFSLIASVILRRDGSPPTPGGGVETDPPSGRLNKGLAQPVPADPGLDLLKSRFSGLA